MILNLVAQRILLFIVGFIVVVHAAVAGNIHDPLDHDETARALQHIMQSQSVNTMRNSLSDDTSANSTEREVTVLVERHRSIKGATDRKADVYVYNYDRNELKQTVVNLDTDTVVSSSIRQHIQLPLIKSEIDRAVELVFTDEEELIIIQAEYLRIVGEPLLSADQLEVKAFAFHASSRPENLNPASMACGLHRCAQLLLYTHDHVVFEVSPIVDLSAEIVTQHIGF